MNQKTHTAGPLLAHDQREDTIDHRYSIMSETGVVALIALHDGTFADLKLWATSPELLDALKWAVARLERFAPHRAVEGDAELYEFASAKAAIAKAEGSA